MSTTPEIFFCFDLTFDSKLNTFLPYAHIAESSKYQYVTKRANPEVLLSMGLNHLNVAPQINKLLTICNTITPEELFKKFAKASKTKKNLDDVLKDPKIVILIQNYIQEKLGLFLNLITQNNLPLSINLGRNKEFYLYQVQHQNNPTQAIAEFDKNENGITYTLLLKNKEKPFYPSEKNILLLVNQPGWYCIDKELYLLNDINSKKLVPFLQKKTVAIPEKMVFEYFEKFIKDIVKKVDIKATGFSVIENNTLTLHELIPVHDFLKNKYVVEIKYYYDQATFTSSNYKKKTHTLLDFENGNSIQVIQYKRNIEKEQIIEDQLLTLGFEKTIEGYFTLDNQNPYDTIDFLIQQKEKLKKLGFAQSPIHINGKTIQSEVATLAIQTDSSNDWFDIKINIQCGEFIFNFTQIIPNLKKNDPFYALPDGSYFLIPQQWMTTYSPLANFAKPINGSLHLPKSNFTILQNIAPFDGAITLQKDIVYNPSPLLQAQLRPYQTQGVQWLLEHYKNGMGACLADDMGLGKTLQTLATLVAVQEELGTNNLLDTPTQLDIFGLTPTNNKKEYLKALIVLPSSLVFNWYNEARKFTPHLRRIQYIGGQRKLLARKLDRYDLVFTSYSVINRDIEVFEKYTFRYLIIDESQQIKNKDSKIFQSINKINALNKISLSGTPIENSLNDLWAQMQFINPDILGSFSFFTNYFKIPIEKNKDEKITQELKEIIAPFLLRRTKEQVLTDLPDMTQQLYYCDMSPEQEKWYEQEKSKARNLLLGTSNQKLDKINVINTLTKLRQLSNHPILLDPQSTIDSGKFEAVTQYLQTLVQAGHKTLIFSSFVGHLNCYQNWCTQQNILFCTLTGSTTLQEREQQVNYFQSENNTLLFFISLKAGGVGLNLTKASYILLLDPWWNPFAEKQAIGRAHRIGQENKVNVIRFVTKNSVEEKIIALQESKTELSETIIDTNSIPAAIETNLSYLLE